MAITSKQYWKPRQSLLISNLHSSKLHVYGKWVIMWPWHGLLMLKCEFMTPATNCQVNVIRSRHTSSLVVLAKIRCSYETRSWQSMGVGINANELLNSVLLECVILFSIVLVLLFMVIGQTLFYSFSISYL